MNRRDFMAGLGGAAAWPLAARAQQHQVPLIGYLDTPEAAADIRGPGFAAFQQGLGEQGYIDGQNVEVLFRYARYDRVSALAEELVRRPFGDRRLGRPGHRLGRKVSHDENCNRVFEWSRPGQAWPG